MITKTYNPGQVQTLYDQNEHTSIAGVLYFKRVNSIALEQKLVDFSTFEDKVASAKQELTDEIEPKVSPFILRTESGIMDFALKIDAIVYPILLLVYRFIINASLQTKPFVLVLINKISRFFSLERYQNTKTAFAKTKTVLSKTPTVVKKLKGFNLPLPLNYILLKSLLNIKPRLFNFRVNMPTISLPSMARMRLSLAIAFLLISFGSMSILLAPLVISQVNSVLMPYSTQNSVNPTPSPITYNSYYKAEENSLYPISEFRISVPKINLDSKIVDNVDPNIEGEYKDKLQFGVAHAKGSYLPPETGGPVYLFAHSTDTIFNIARFNAKFYSVRELEAGDEIDLFFNNKKYSYRVRVKEVINPQEIDRVRQTDADLVLQTCWPPGTDWQRLVVYADLVSDLAVPVERSI